MQLYTHCVSKNVPPLTCCNLYTHGSIASASALPAETGNPEIASFHLSAACFFTKKYETVLKYQLVRAEPPFAVKTIDWMHQTGPRKGYEHRILLSVTHMLCDSVLAKSVTVSVAVWKMGVVLRQAWSKSQWTVLMGYLTISTNVRRYETHHKWQFFFFQEDSAQVHCVCNTIQLSEKCDFRVSWFWHVVHKLFEVV